jgi:hypothetical protein
MNPCRPMAHAAISPAALASRWPRTSPAPIAAAGAGALRDRLLVQLAQRRGGAH